MLSQFLLIKTFLPPGWVIALRFLKSLTIMMVMAREERAGSGKNMTRVPVPSAMMMARLPLSVKAALPKSSLKKKKISLW